MKRRFLVPVAVAACSQWLSLDARAQTSPQSDDTSAGSSAPPPPPPSAEQPPAPASAPGGAPQTPPNPPAADAAAWERARAYAAWQAANQQEWMLAPREPERRWYGWQTLIVDGASLTLFIGGASSAESNNAGSGFGFLGYIFGAPIVHGAHGHWGKAAGSFGIRVGSTALIVAGVLSCFDKTLFTHDSCSGAEALVILGSLGFFGAVVIDAAVLAREDVEPGEEARLILTPWVDASRRGGGLALRGAL